jgi:hypothetical protein
MVCSLELGSISQSQNQLSKFKKAVGSLLLLQHKLSWPQKGGPPIVSSKVRILALQLSTWPSAYDATPCHEWRSTWVLVSVKLSVHHFNIAKSYHQMFPLNLSIPIILVCSKLLYIMTLICLFVCLFVCSITTSSVMLWNLQVYVQLWKVHGHKLDSQSLVHGHGEPAYTCTFTLLNETSEWPSNLTLKFGFPDPDVYSLRPVSVIQFKLSVFPGQWSRWRNL